MCGLDVTEKCTLTRGQILKLCQSGHPVARVCGDMAGFSLENTSDKYRGETSMHDVAPLMYMTHPEIFRAVFRYWTRTVQRGRPEAPFSEDSAGGGMRRRRPMSSP